MPTIVQFRRGTTAQNNAFTGATGEISVDTTDNRLVVHDGSTAGGSRLALASETIFRVIADDSTGIYLQGGTDELRISGGNGISTSTDSGGSLTVSLDASDSATFNGGVVVDNITIDGTEIDLSSGDLTIDVEGDITLDANGQQIFFAKGGTTFGQFGTESTPSTFTIESTVSDGDINFKGNDGGSGITAMTIDMSEGGKVGIGTTSPATILDVDGGANSDQATFSGTASRGLKISTFAVGAADEGVDFDAQASGTTQALTFSTGGTERVRVDKDGLKFNGDTATANALDDYEEGTFTPAISGTGNSNNDNSGRYIKIGKMVTVSVLVNDNGSNTFGSGSVEFTNMPFTSVSSHPASGVSAVRHRFVTFPSNTTQLMAFVLSNTTTCRLEFSGSANFDTMVGTDVNNDSSLAMQFSVTYEVA